jgi:methanogenic corrinoid protein MtbC1
MANKTIPKDVSDRLAEALMQGDPDAAVTATEDALAKGIDPLALIQQVVVPTLTEVGRRFEELDIFLPELMAAGEAGNACSQVIEEALLKGHWHGKG